MNSPIVRVRLPDDYGAALASLGGNQSAALRACILLALATLGRDMEAFQGEMTRGAFVGVTPEVLEAVQAALIGCGTGVAQVWHSPPAMEVAADDPFASIGIEV